MSLEGGYGSEETRIKHGRVLNLCGRHSSVPREAAEALGLCHGDPINNRRGLLTGRTRNAVDRMLTFTVRV
jgi:hypothetical protein